MIRVVSLKKAIAAGVAGAAVMEIFSLATRLAGVETVDLVRQLSSVPFPESPLAKCANPIRRQPSNPNLGLALRAM